MPNWEKIREEWETTKITFKALAEKHDVKEGTLKSRRSREGWSRDATTSKKDATKSKKVATVKDANENKKTTSNAHKKRSGNPNPKNQFTKRNQVARKHGLFANFIQPEQQEIIDEMQTMSIADQLWMQIEIKFSAIIRMQKIMWVDNKHDHLDKLSGESAGDAGMSETYKVIYAHERYESYIKAQTRAMAEYRNLVKQYIEITDEFDERRLRLEGMQVNIEKTHADIAVSKSKVPNKDTANMNEQITALADLINNPVPDRVIDDD